MESMQFAVENNTVSRNFHRCVFKTVMTVSGIIEQCYEYYNILFIVNDIKYKNNNGTINVTQITQII